MQRFTLVCVLLAIAAIATACGGGSGGSSGSVTYAPTVVPIKHIDFTAVDLASVNVTKLPQSLLDQYPPIVATANDQQVSGQSLAAREVALELARRNWEQASPEDFPQDFVQSQIVDAASADPLELEIDNALERSSAELLGIMPSDQEAEDAAKQYDGHLKGVLEGLAPDLRARFESNLAILGQLDPGWWSQPTWIKRFRDNMGAKAVRDRFCTLRATPTGTANFLMATDEDCSAFLAKERKNAKIVYYVRWAD